MPASNLHVERYIPQHVILDRSAAVISHCGSGTMLAALSNEIPQVCIPQAADQFANADTCASVGAGITISTDVSVQTVSDALARVLGDDRYRDAARTGAREIEPCQELTPSWTNSQACEGVATTSIRALATSANFPDGSM